MRGLEARLEHPEQLPPQQAQQLQQDVSSITQRLRSLLYLAGGTINTLAVSTTEVGGMLQEHSQGGGTAVWLAVHSTAGSSV